MSGPKDIREIPRPADVTGALIEAAETLSRLGGDFALIGGVALALYGIERYTRGVDLAVSVAQSAAAERALPDADPQPLRIGGVSFMTSSGVRVDLIDRRFHYGALFEEAIAAASRSGLRARAGQVEVPVVSLPYLIAMKLAADRPLDEADILALLKKPELDYPATRDIVERHLGHFAARRLDRMARAEGRRDAPADYENGSS